MLPRQGHAFHAMESSRKGDGFILFASAKRTKKQLLGRAKSCQWQVFVRRRPPKQGELRTDVSKATMFQGEREQKYAQRAAPTGACFLLVRKFPKGKRFYVLFAFCKKNQKARAACCPDRGMLSAVRKFLKGNGFILFACTKRTGSTPEVCGPLDSENGSNRRSKRCFG